MICPKHRRSLKSTKGDRNQQVLKCTVLGCGYVVEVGNVKYRDGRSLGKSHGNAFMRAFNRAFNLKDIIVEAKPCSH